MMTLFESIKSALATISGVASCRIGLEDNITPDDYPLIRIVPSRIADEMLDGERRAEMLIYFGLPIQSFDDTPDSGGRVRLEKVYAALFDLEDAIRDKLAPLNVRYLETITDEDRLDTYKLMAVRCEVEG